jgi:hypothetical protein
MKNIFKYKFKGLAMLCLLAGLVFLSSCDDEESGSKEVVLLSFGPAGVHHGDEIVFIGQNLDKVSSIVFPPGVEVASSSFTSVSADKFTVVVPHEAEAGTLVLKTPSGDIATKTILNFEVPVVISSVTPEVKPGTNITIKGDLLNWIESVTFPSDIVIEKKDFVSSSISEVVIKVPMEAQSGFLLFETGGTEPLSFGTEEQVKVSLPAVTNYTSASVKHTDNLTINGTDLDLVTSITFQGNKTVEKANFVSQSASSIVVKIPVGTLKGTITLKQLSPVNVVTTQEITIILPAVSSVSPTPTKPGVDNLTLTGTNLDLVKTIVLPGSGATSTFISQSATEIVLAVPANASQGAITYVTIHDYAAPLEGAVLKLPPQGNYPTLDYYIYKDGLQTGWQAYGGWGHVSQSYSNTENPASGTTAIKSVFNDAYGAVQIKNNNAATVFAGYNYLVFYVYVPNESSNIIVQINNGADYYPAGFTMNKYHQIVVPISSLAGASSVSELRFKNNNSDAATNNTTVFIDEIGLTVDVPAPPVPSLFTTIYDDAAKSGFGQWGGFGGATTTFGSIEQYRGGANSIKVTYPASGNYAGGAQMGGGNVSTAGTTHFAFSVYGGPGTEGKMLQALVKRTGGEASRQVTLREGKWTDFEIPLADLGNPANITELFFQNANFNNTVIYIDHIGLK